MFYEPAKNNHGLKYNPFKGCIVPRPIAWISSMSKDGVTNLAPYSYFNAVAEHPPILMFATGSKKGIEEKDSLRNIEQTKEFVVNIVSASQVEEMLASSLSLEYGVSEIDHFKIATVPSQLIKPPRVKNSLVQMECIYLQTVKLPKSNDKVSNKVIFGEVVGIHIDDSIIFDDMVDIKKLQPVCRLGYKQYSVVETFFELERPQ